MIDAKTGSLWVPFLFIVFASTLCMRGQPDKLIWSQEFDGAKLDETYWNFQLGDGCPELCGWGNNEPQRYTRSNHRMEDGFLIIQGRKEDSIYTSTRITTQGKFEFQYGRVEVRAKLPKGRGVWPAIWLLGSNIGEVGWPRCGEIDIVEYLGRQPGHIFTSLHTAASWGDHTVNKKISEVPGIEEDFHRYEMDWTAERIRFLLDGEEIYTFIPSDRSEEVWPFDQPLYLIINMAIGGNFGGHDIDDTALPQDFVIDYVRVYRQ